MAIFKLETGAVSSAAGQMQSIASQITSLSSTVNGYDTSCEDGFDFASVKSLIAQNIEACSTKVQNAAKVLENVVSAHTELQNSLKFNASAASGSSGLKVSNSGSNSKKSSSGTYSGGGGYSGGSYIAASTGTTSGVQARESTSTSNNTSSSEIQNKPTSVDFVCIEQDKMSDDTKKIFSSNDFKYDDNGYARLKDRYVIACDSSMGKVGDLLKFTQKDGTVIECVVGAVTSSDDMKNKLNFIIKDNSLSKAKEAGIAKNILKNNEKINNSGYYDRSQSTAVLAGGAPASSDYTQGAMDWAVSIANDDSHGYSQATRYGNPNYDCSSLVISSWDAAGVPVKDAGATYTGDMREAFLSTGQFEWIPGNPDVNDLQPGDILLNEGQHTEMYIGNGLNVGAHGNHDGVDGDSGGGEICVSDYYSFPWDGVLRYIGK